MIKISVIIPAHNEENYISKTIESLKKNKIPFELIVICDSCTDKTKEISLKYTDLVYEVDFKNVSKARNFGVIKSTGDILVFLDADTSVSENYLEEISRIINNYDYGSAKCVSESKSVLGKYLSWSVNNYYRKNIGGNFFVKKSIFNSARGFDEQMKMGEDTDLGDKLKKIGAKYCFIKNCFLIPSERKYREQGYIYLIIKSGINGLIYKFFRKYYNRKIAIKFYE